MVLLAGLTVESEADGLQLLSQRIRIRFLDSGAAHRGLLHLLDHGLVGLRGFNGELAREQVIAAIALGNFDHVAAVAPLGTTFFEHDFHFQISRICSKRRLPEGTQLARELLDADTPRLKPLSRFSARQTAAEQYCAPA